MTSPEWETHTWVVESIAGVPTTDPKPQISLGEDGRLSGSTGVNRIMGTYEAQGEVVRISGTGMTRMAGPPEAMEQERRFLDAIEGWQAFHMGDGRLQIGPVDRAIVLVLADPPDSPDSG
jgi:heat shock protein HslJ